MIRHWFCALLCLAIPAFSGCGNNLRTQRQVDQFGVQRRVLEDQIYDLQYEYNKLADQVEELETEKLTIETGSEYVKSLLEQFKEGKLFTSNPYLRTSLFQDVSSSLLMHRLPSFLQEKI